MQKPIAVRERSTGGIRLSARVPDRLGVRSSASNNRGAVNRAMSKKTAEAMAR